MLHRVILVKLLPEKYEADFLDGYIYFNTNAYFGIIDHKDEVRFDPDDGIDESRQVSKVEIQDHTGNWLPLQVIGPITTRSEVSAKQNVLCLFTITDRAGDSFNEQNLAFGERAVVIDNLQEFICRVKRATEQVSKKLSLGPIEYVEYATYDGPMGPFRKFTTHRYKNEFRLVLSNGTRDACRLSVGNLRDIAHAIDARDVPRYWQGMLRLPRTDA